MEVLSLIRNWTRRKSTQQSGVLSLSGFVGLHSPSVGGSYILASEALNASNSQLSAPGSPFPGSYNPGLPSLDAEIPPRFDMHGAPHNQPGPQRSVDNNSAAEKVGTTYLTKCIN